MCDMSRCKHGGFVGYCENCTPFEVHEIGPWTVDEWSNDRIVLQSQDFTHDAALEVSGDFGSKENRRKYAEEIARRLNTATHNVELTGTASRCPS
jgi:hypothetical protein